MDCPNCGGGVVHLYFGGGKGEWRCLAGCGWTSRNGGKKCVVCGAPNAYLCDYPVGDGKTCDAPLCWRHTYKPDKDKDIDYCPEHRDETRRKAGLPKYTDLDADEVRKLWQSGEGMVQNPIKQERCKNCGQKLDAGRLKALAEKIEAGEKPRLRRRHGCVFVEFESGDEIYLGL